MATDSPFDLICGEAVWLKACRCVLILIATVTLLAADTTQPWKFISLASLVTVSFIFQRRLYRNPPPRRVRLFGEGHLSLMMADGEKVAANLANHAWSSPWFCILPVIRTDDGSTNRVLICRSRNQSVNYRKLLSALRLGSAAQLQNGILER